MQLYLIRHAESENNARPPQNRVEDPAITSLGRLQADHLAAWLQTLRMDHLITSPFRRTLQTLRPTIDRVDHTVEVWHDIFERGGCYRGYLPDQTEGGPGLGRRAVIEHLVGDSPHLCVVDDSISESGWWHGKLRETHEEAITRATSVVHRLTQTFGHSGKVVVMVTHADFKRELMLQMLEGVSDAAKFGPLRNCGISKVDFDGKRWKLDWLNSVTHMPARLVTGNES